jgi:hypothetical protein
VLLRSGEGESDHPVLPGLNRIALGCQTLLDCMSAGLHGCDIDIASGKFIRGRDFAGNKTAQEKADEKK